MDSIVQLAPVDFFQISWDLPFAKEIPSRFSGSFTLPDTSEFLGEDSFALMKMACHEKGLLIHARVEKPYEESFFPNWEKGDSLELFIDTRDLKTTGFMTKFCHHFVIVPEKEGSAHEVTRFRTDDNHPLCSPEDILVTTSFEKKAYEMKIEISSACLHGYDPLSFDRLGFTYRFNRYGGAPQHFSVSSQDYAIERHPSLWASFKMKRD